MTEITIIDLDTDPGALTGWLDAQIQFMCETLNLEPPSWLGQVDEQDIEAKTAPNSPEVAAIVTAKAAA